MAIAVFLLTSVREQGIVLRRSCAFERTTMRGGGGDLAVKGSRVAI